MKFSPLVPSPESHNSDSPLNRPWTIARIGENARRFFAEASGVPTEEYLEAQTERQRLDILGLPNDISGLDLARIDAFRTQMGALKKTVCFLSEEDFARMTQEIGCSNNEPYGVYYSVLGIALVQRNRELEVLNGSEITESLAIHEIAHSSHFESPIKLVRKTSGGLLRKKSEFMMTTAQNGFWTNSSSDRDDISGKYFEEGYAEYERGLYVEQNDLIDAFTTGAVNYQMAKECRIPMKYFHKQNNEGRPSLTLSPGAVIASIMDVLITRDASLQTTMRQARQSPDGLGLFKDHLNDLMPGLFDKLQHADDLAATKLLIQIKSKES